MDQAEDWNAKATEIQSMAEEKKSGSFRHLYNKAANNATANAERATRRANMAHRMGRPVPEGARKAIARDTSGLVKGSSKLSGVGRGALRGLPFVGTGFTVASGVGDVVMGKDPLEAAEDTGADLAGGAAGGWAGAAIGTAIFPGVGTVVGGAIGGMIGSWVAGEAADAATGE